MAVVRVLALIKENEGVVGLRLFDEKFKSVGDFKLSDATKFINTYGCSNVTINSYGDIECVECHIDRLPILNTKLQLVNSGGIFILARGCYKGLKIFDIVNVSGQVKRVKEDVLIKYVNSEKQKYTKRGLKPDTPILINAKIVFKGDIVLVSAIKGSFKRIPVKDLEQQYGKLVTNKPKIDGIPMEHFRKNQVDDSLYRKHLNHLDEYKREKFTMVMNYAHSSPLFDYSQGKYAGVREDDSRLGAILNSFWSVYNEVPERYSTHYIRFWCNVVELGKYTGVINAYTGETIIPVWFGDCDIHIKINCKDLYSVSVKHDGEDLYGFVNMRTRKVTKIAYRDIRCNTLEGTGNKDMFYNDIFYNDIFYNAYGDMVEVHALNIFTGEVENISETLNNSTSYLDDLLEFVPTYWKRPHSVAREQNNYIRELLHSEHNWVTQSAIKRWFINFFLKEFNLSELTDDTLGGKLNYLHSLSFRQIVEELRAKDRWVDNEGIILKDALVMGAYNYVRQCETSTYNALRDIILSSQQQHKLIQIQPKRDYNVYEIEKFTYTFI